MSRIIFFGGSKFSQYYLDALKNTRNEVCAFNTLPTKEEVDRLSPDIGIIAYFGYIVPEDILRIPKKGFINVHYSLLPRWRGPAPVQAAILAGDKEIGVSVAVVVKKVDAGPIIAQETVPLAPNDSYQSLEEKLIPLGSKMLLAALPKYLTGSAELKAQNETEATYSKKINKSDGRIDWSESAEYIERMTRAYDPWPSAYTEIHHQTKILKIKRAAVISAPAAADIGAIFKTADGFPAVVCGTDALKLVTVQPEGKKEMPGDAYLRGNKFIF